MDSSPGAPWLAQPFDAVAADYDATFTARRRARWARERVWERLAESFAPGDRILDLGCGSGEDAIWLARRDVHVTASDVSPEMLATTSRKAERAGIAERVTTVELDLNRLATSRDASEVLGQPFDGVVSNFGPINCVENRAGLFEALAHVVKPGGRVVLVVMGPICPWEIAWFLAHGQLSAARRRFKAGANARVGDGLIRVWYPSPGRLCRESARSFRAVEVAGLSLLLPPSDIAGFIDRMPRLTSRLAAVDRQMGGTRLWRAINDHYLLVLERR